MDSQSSDASSVSGDDDDGYGYGTGQVHASSGSHLYSDINIDDEASVHLGDLIKGSFKTAVNYITIHSELTFSTEFALVAIVAIVALFLSGSEYLSLNTARTNFRNIAKDPPFIVPRA